VLEVLYIADSIMVSDRDCAAAPALLCGVFGAPAPLLDDATLRVTRQLLVHVHEAVLFASVGVKAAYHAAAQLMKAKMLASVPASEATAPTSAPTSAPTDMTDALKCVACFGNARQYAFQPCGHVATCLECTMAVMATCAQRCPLCRARSTVMRVYF
jgi:hypothetical protein